MKAFCGTGVPAVERINIKKKKKREEKNTHIIIATVILEIHRSHPIV
jgi:hypothetical protein